MAINKKQKEKKQISKQFISNRLLKYIHYQSNITSEYSIS